MNFICQMSYFFIFLDMNINIIYIFVLFIKAKQSFFWYFIVIKTLKCINQAMYYKKRKPLNIQL